MSKQPSSYAQILKSSAIVGGAQGIDLLIRMVRVKLMALLLGPSGVGLIGVFQSSIELIGKVTGLGIRASGVRQIAEAGANGRAEVLGVAVTALQRTAWVTGLLGFLLMGLISQPLGLWLFGNQEYTVALGLLGIVLLAESVAGGQSALLQGMRRITDLARVMVYSAAGGTIVSLILFSWFGERGIVPALIMSAFITLASSWWYSHKVETPAVAINWRRTAKEIKPLISLGLAFMWSGILTAGVALVIRGLIVRNLGLDANGLYQAAWGISGMFAGFILGAMGQDFYPRLTEVSSADGEVNRLVNEQMEVGLLLALPGLLATLAFSPLVIKVFYSTKFTAASDMLPWFVLGVFGRVISWPMGFIQLAKGNSKMFAVTETLANGLHLLFVWVGLTYLGIVGVAVAFAVMYACHSTVVYLVAVRLTGFRWSKSAVRLASYATLLIAVQFGILEFSSGLYSSLISLGLVFGSTVYFFRQLILRLGPTHRLSLFVSTIPWIGRHGGA